MSYDKPKIWFRMEDISYEVGEKEPEINPRYIFDLRDAELGWRRTADIELKELCDQINVEEEIDNDIETLYDEIGLAGEEMTEDGGEDILSELEKLSRNYEHMDEEGEN